MYALVKTLFVELTTIDAGSPMWALPGYGDHLEEFIPGLRAGMKQMGAPEGFEDVVAMILPRDGGSARWSIEQQHSIRE